MKNLLERRARMVKIAGFVGKVTWHVRSTKDYLNLAEKSPKEIFL
jgi:hypothetical protein